MLGGKSFEFDSVSATIVLSVSESGKDPGELISSFLFPPPGLTPLAPVASHRFPGIILKLQRFPGQAFISQTRNPSPEK